MPRQVAKKKGYRGVEGLRAAPERSRRGRFLRRPRIRPRPSAFAMDALRDVSFFKKKARNARPKNSSPPRPTSCQRAALGYFQRLFFCRRLFFLGANAEGRLESEGGIGNVSVVRVFGHRQIGAGPRRSPSASSEMLEKKEEGILRACFRLYSASRLYETTRTPPARTLFFNVSENADGERRGPVPI